MIATEDLGRWTHYGVHIRASQPNAEARNGLIEVWKNGQVIASNPDFPLGGSSATLPAKSLLLTGWWNSAPETDVPIDIDEFKIFAQDPGW